MNYAELIEGVKSAKTNYTDETKFTAALYKEINRILYKAVDL